MNFWGEGEEFRKGILGQLKGHVVDLASSSFVLGGDGLVSIEHISLSLLLLAAEVGGRWWWDAKRPFVRRQIESQESRITALGSALYRSTKTRDDERSVKTCCLFRLAP